MSTAKGQIGEKERTVFWRHYYSGELQIAPDTRMAAPMDWLRIECQTAKETEFYSRKLAMQEFEKMRSVKIEEHIRYKTQRDQMRARCILRKAKGYISEADEIANETIIARQNQKDELLYKLLSNEPDLSRASLEIEKYDAQTIRARSGGKRQGLADEEVNTVGKMLEGVR